MSFTDINAASGRVTGVLEVVAEPVDIHLGAMLPSFLTPDTADDSAGTLQRVPPPD